MYISNKSLNSVQKSLVLLMASVHTSVFSLLFNCLLSWWYITDQFYSDVILVERKFYYHPPQKYSLHTRILIKIERLTCSHYYQLLLSTNFEIDAVLLDSNALLFSTILLKESYISFGVHSLFFLLFFAY